MEGVAKSTLELQGGEESEVYKVINGSNNARNMKPKSCGTTHKSSECYFRNETCRKCGKVGHIQRVCRSGKSQNSTRRRKEEKPNLHAFEVDDERDDDSLVALPKVNNLKQVEAGYVIWWHQKKWNLAQAQQYPLQRYQGTFSNTRLVDTFGILKTYSGENIKPEGKLLVPVEHNNQAKDLTLCVVKTHNACIVRKGLAGYTK